MFYASASEDLGVHHFRPVAISTAVNNRMVGRTQLKEVKWKTVGKGYTFETWENLGRWLMIAYASEDYNNLLKDATPTIAVPVKTSLAPTWKTVQGTFMPSKNITRIGIIYPAPTLAGYDSQNVTICREFDMFTSFC